MKPHLSRFLVAATIALAMAVGAFAEREPMLIVVGDLRLTAPAQWFVADVPSDEPSVSQVLASDDAADSQALLIISKIPRQGRTLESYSSTTRQFISTEMDGVVESERARSVQGYPAHVFVYEGRSKQPSQGRRMFMRMTIEKGRDFYVLQGVANHIPFVEHTAAIEGMFNSIVWRK